VSVVRHVLLLLLAFVLQTTWLHLLAVSGLRPDLILVVLVHIALRTSQVESTVLGFGAGFLQDLYAPADLGLNALTKSLIGFAVSYGRTGVVADSVQVQIAFLCGSVVVHDLIYYLGSSGVSLATAPVYWLGHGLGQGLYTCVLGVLISVALVGRRWLLTGSRPVS
jgi:rod shape-determining protein MreD